MLCRAEKSRAAQRQAIIDGFLTNFDEDQAQEIYRQALAQANFERQQEAEAKELETRMKEWQLQNAAKEDEKQDATSAHDLWQNEAATQATDYRGQGESWDQIATFSGNPWPTEESTRSVCLGNKEAVSEPANGEDWGKDDEDLWSEDNYYYEGDGDRKEDGEYTDHDSFPDFQPYSDSEPSSERDEDCATCGPDAATTEDETEKRGNTIQDGDFSEDDEFLLGSSQSPSRHTHEAVTTTPSSKHPGSTASSTPDGSTTPSEKDWARVARLIRDSDWRRFASAIAAGVRKTQNQRYARSDGAADHRRWRSEEVRKAEEEAHRENMATSYNVVSPERAARKGADNTGRSRPLVCPCGVDETGEAALTCPWNRARAESRSCPCGLGGCGQRHSSLRESLVPVDVLPGDGGHAETTPERSS